MTEIDKNKKKLYRYALTFDFKTKNLEIYADSKTKPYNDIKKYLVNELGFTHQKDSDYISPFVTKNYIYGISEKISKNFLFFSLCVEKANINEVNEKLFDVKKIMEKQISLDKSFSEKL
ncbi:MAG: hypothetical protein LBC44_03565 [Mycoplasmataceae bacterium]|jgi:virulence-associated protein VapD|nr:hypothetical protein [Mycoplasmataceae bacterium]